MASIMHNSQDVCPPTTIDELAFEPTENPFYQPAAGELSSDSIREIEGGKLFIGAYRSVRASHRVGVYMPDDLKTAKARPTVLKSGPLGTAAAGHNQSVAEEMMREGFVVISKGVPRYHRPRPKAISLAEDANEMFGVLQAVEQKLDLGNTDEVFIYGESQAAMKAVGAMAIAGDYNRQVIDGLVVAACFFKRLNLQHIHRQPERLIRMGLGVASFVLHTTPEIRERLKGTINFKDLHHHITVIPVLTSGETGDFLPFIPKDQKFTNLSFGRDGNSHPYHVQADLQQRFPNAKTIVLDHYGHVDGIKSEETANLRASVLKEVREIH